MRTMIVCAAVLLAAGARASTELRVDGSRFADGAGRTVVLRGVNVGGSSKVPPFRALTAATQLDPLPGWGINVIRFLFTWEAWQPDSATAYDDSYLAYYTGMVDAAWARGIYVVVDIHQDAFSRYALNGCGEGFPKWALPSSVAPATPNNGPSCADWGTRQLGNADQTTIWNNFYDPQSDAQKAYLAMLGKLAAALAGHPGVIGYDLINEPHGDEPTQLAPLEAAAAAAVRAADPSAIVFISPSVVGGSAGTTKLPRPSLTNFAYAPHYYDPGVYVLHSWDGTDETVPIDALRATATQWGVPLFLGEFGIPPDYDNAAGYSAAIYALLDQSFASSTQWVYTPGWNAVTKDGWNSEDFSIVDNTGALRANFTPHGYAQKIAGTPMSLSVSTGASGSMTFAWTHDPLAGATELFVPGSVLFGTSALAITTTGSASCTQSGLKVSCTAPAAGAASVTLRAKPADTTPPPKPTSKKSCGLTGIEAVAILWILRRRRRPGAHAAG